MDEDEARLKALVERAEELVAEMHTAMGKQGEPTATDIDHLKCSFCGKSNADVAKIIAGPGVYICNECVDLCVEIIEGEDSES